MKKLISTILIAVFLIPTLTFSARTDGLWNNYGTYMKPIPVSGLNVLIYGLSKYLNFGSTSGTTGYGFRDNSGIIEHKDSGGSWSNFGSSTQKTISGDIWFTGLTNCDTIDTDAYGLLSCGSDASGSGGTGSNWTYDTNFGADALTASTTIPVWFKDAIYATSTIHADGGITTDTGFYGDYWISSTGNSMNIQPTGDTDDFFSFKTPANRPTIKREGGKFIYLESSNVYDVGISARADATYSGTLNYEKDNHMMTMLGKNSPLGFKANSDYDDYIKIQTTSNTPEITVASSSAFKINAGGTNSLLLNHSGGNVGVGTTSPYKLLSVAGAGHFDGAVTADGNITGANLNISNWDTAHGWGDHSVAGYNSQAFASSTYAIAGGAFHDGFSDFVANEHLDWTQNVGTIHSGNYTTLTNLTDFDQTAWRLFYSTALGDVVELSLGADGQYLKSQGGTSTLTWGVPTDTNTNANTICSGGTTYLDGEGNCDDISSVYQPLDAQLTDLADGTLTGNFVNTANPWADNEVSDTLTVTGYMQDGDINTFSELQSWVSDETLLKAGTLTDTKYCIYDSASGDIICNSEGGAGYTNLTSFVDQTAWKLFYSNASGDVTELTLGSSGEYLKSNGAAAAPTWATPSGSALFTDSGTFTYLTATTDDFVIGSNATSTADLFVDVSTGLTTIEALTIDDGTTSATTTLELGASTNIGCIKMRDSDDGGWSYLTILNGTLTASQTSCK